MTDSSASQGLSQTGRDEVAYFDQETVGLGPEGIIFWSVSREKRSKRAG